MVFSKIKKELPLVALFNQEKIHFHKKKAFHFHLGRIGSNQFAG
jgi:hypothetical protein